MRPIVFASLALALGTASLSSYAACTSDEYNQNITQLQVNYNGAATRLTELDLPLDWIEQHELLAS